MTKFLGTATVAALCALGVCACDTTAGTEPTKVSAIKKVVTPAPTNPQGSSQADRFASLLGGKRLDVMIFEEAVKVGGIPQGQANAAARLILEAKSRGEDEAFMAYVQLQANDAAASIKSISPLGHPLQGMAIPDATGAVRFFSPESGQEFYTAGESVGGTRPNHKVTTQSRLYDFTPSASCSADYGVLINYTASGVGYTSLGSNTGEVSVPPSTASMVATFSDVVDVPLYLGWATWSVHIDNIGRNYAGACR